MREQQTRNTGGRFICAKGSTGTVLLLPFRKAELIKKRKGSAGTVLLLPFTQSGIDKKAQKKVDCRCKCLMIS